ncbi:MAG: hypothetical protein ACR2RL_01420, partial [Gammaproteobacteria bacterium]
MTNCRKPFSFFPTFLGSLCLGLAVGAPVRSVLAEDTEIYTGDIPSLQSVRPNVLFIIDTSASMKDPGDANGDGTVATNEPRKWNMLVQAYNNLLDDAQDVNFGIMRFSQPGGPILFPVSNVNASLETIATGIEDDTITVNVRSGDDDASEVQERVTVDGSELKLIYDPAQGTDSRTATLQVEDSDDDAYWALRGSGLKLYADYSLSSPVFPASATDRVLTWLGMRYLPPFNTLGARVTRADLVFNAAGTYSAGTPAVEYTFRAHAVDNSPPFPATATALTSTSNCIGFEVTGDPFCRFLSSGNPTSTGTVPDFKPGEQFTVDVKDQVQAIFDRSGWHDGTTTESGLTLLGRFSQGQSEKFGFITRDGNPIKAPQLTVHYDFGPEIKGAQTVGLRFRNVNIPQSAKILSAYLTVTPSADSTNAVNMQIYGEASSTPAAFTTATSDISGRQPLANRVPWKLTSAEPWVNDQAVNSPSLVDVVQDIVNQGDWCGGKDMGIIMKWNGGLQDGRPIHSYELDSTRAAKLHIVFDEDTAYGPGEGCMTQNVSVQVRGGGGDAEENPSTGVVIAWRNTVNRLAAQVTGLRFANVPIPRGATVIDASLDVSHGGTDNLAAGAGTLTISGQKSADAHRYLTVPFDITSRPVFTGPKSVVTASVPTRLVSKGDRYTIPGLADLLNDIVNQPQWNGGNALGLTVKPSIGGLAIRTFNREATDGAILRASIEYKLGDLPGGVVSARTVKHRLREIVEAIVPRSNTPLVGTLYEAARYYRGESVYYGKNRGNYPFLQTVTRVSHRDSYTGGKVVRPKDCTAEKLDSVACRGEHIDGTPIYKSPITESCQTSYVVMLTDGLASIKADRDKIESDYKLTCASNYEGGDSAISVTEDEMCGPELAAQLFENDQSPTAVDGFNNVRIYTIGFGIEDNAFIRAVARRGGGGRYLAGNTSQLTNVFRTIVGEIVQRTTSFSSPALTVNAFNQLSHSNKVYMALFEPQTRRAWPGNLKKYKLCNTVGEHSTCSLGEVLDADDQKLTDNDDRIKPSSRSEWAVEDDGGNVQAGGAAGKMVLQGARTIYTYLDVTQAPQDQGDANDRRLSQHLLIDADNDGAIDNISTFASGNALAATRSLLDLGTAATAAKVGEHIDWIRGIDVDDEDVDGKISEPRYFFGDPLHSEPQAVTYGATDTDDPENTDITKVFLGSNDGGLRMMNALTGEEEWIFFPQSVLAAQNEMRENRAGERVYGIDGTPTIWRKDDNRNGYIEPRAPDEDFVRVIAGMRRGGNAYYALDVTPTDRMAHRTNRLIVPELMWRIQGSSAAYPRLGQTWSRPLLRTIRVGTTTEGESELKTVMFVAGGYDQDYDQYYKTTDSLGNGFYIVDPENGKRLFYVSGTAHLDVSGVNRDGITVPGMVYPVPSDLTLMDSDG